MPLIEVLPNSSSTSAPGWAYVPDTGYDPSKAAIQPSGARKRAARASGFAGGEPSARQQNAISRRLADLDKDNHRDVNIPLPAKSKDGGGRVSKGKTPVTRKILLAQKTFANYIADEEAALALQEQQQPTSSHRPAVTTSTTKTPSTQFKRPTSTTNVPTLTGTSPTNTANPTSAGTTSLPPTITGQEAADARLLESYSPTAPSEELLDALIKTPALSYNAARATPSTSGKPQRHFCEICGYWGKVKCMRCGARVCGLECKRAHDDGRCLNF